MISLASHAAEWRTPRERPPPPPGGAQREGGESRDAGGDARRAIRPAPAHRGHSRHELRLAERSELLRPRGAVHRVALEEHGGDHVVAGADVGEELVEE